MAKKKVTLKKFKEIYVNSGCAFNEKDIDYGIILCLLSNYHFSSAEEMEKDGYIHAAESYRRIARIMHNELFLMGYFDN